MDAPQYALQCAYIPCFPTLCGVSMCRYVYLLMGVLIGSAVIPIAYCLCWSKCTAIGAITGAVSGLCLAIMSWLISAKTLEGEISLYSTGGNNPRSSCCLSLHPPPRLHIVRWDAGTASRACDCPCSSNGDSTLWSCELEQLVLPPVLSEWRLQEALAASLLTPAWLFSPCADAVCVCVLQARTTPC